MCNHIIESLCNNCCTFDCPVKLNLVKEPIHLHCLQYTSQPKVNLTIEEINYINNLLNDKMEANNSWYEKLKGWQQSEADEFKKTNRFIQRIIDKLNGGNYGI